MLAKKSPYNPDRRARPSQAAEILEKVKKRYHHAKYDQIRKANVPFYCVDAAKIEQLKELTDEYKSLHGQNPEAAAPVEGQSPGIMSSFINFSKMHSKLQESGKLVKHHGGRAFEKDEKPPKSNLKLTPA